MEDISRILNGWDFDPEDICARKIVGLDGREKLQVRVDLGVLQMELDGRPDGSRPGGHPSALDFQLSRLAEHQEKTGGDDGFVLGDEECEDLGQEGLQYYHRYICLMRLGEFEQVIEDTDHNLAIFDLVSRFAVEEEQKMSFEQYRPYVLMINTRARGELRLKQDDYDGALLAVREGMARIHTYMQTMDEVAGDDEFEEIRALETWASEIEESRPVSLKQRLAQQLQDAIAEEKYERAARLRDRIRGLEERRF